MGNLFSVKNACEQVGMEAGITSNAREIRQAGAVILHGVGAFGEAMKTLRRLGLVDLLQEVAASGKGKPFIGICLGMQLLMTESFEFGRHPGLGLIKGQVVRFEPPPKREALKPSLKVPQIGWNQIHPVSPRGWGDSPETSPLAGLSPGEYMYFVHSFHALVRLTGEDSFSILSATQYGPVSFCSSFRRGNIVAFQFHPERSGPIGLQIYKNLAQWIIQSNQWRSEWLNR